MNTFETEVFGKWILAGEHSVLRGSKALVFPVFSKSLRLKYESNESEFQVSFGGSRGDEFRMLFNGVMEKSLDMLDRNRSEIKGKFLLENEIAVGAGMGASAALCVAWGNWLAWKSWLKKEDLYEFCRELENLFHGESSGVDVAVALSSQGLVFKRDGFRDFFQPKWQPNWYLSFSGKRGLTSECIAKVKTLSINQPELSLRLDQEMNDCAERAIRILSKNKSSESEDELISILEKASSIFSDWGLISPELQNHIEWLRSHGATATKPTGSGEGGYVLSYWKEAPNEETLKQLIPLNR